MIIMWEAIGEMLDRVYGVEVNSEEGFFLCPECGEPIYAADYLCGEPIYGADYMNLDVCPVCGFNWFNV